jgi:hypothetical protein
MHVDITTLLYVAWRGVTIYSRTELGIRYFLPYSISDIPILQCLYSISIFRYFSEICSPIRDIRYRYFFNKSL